MALKITMRSACLAIQNRRVSSHPLLAALKIPVDNFARQVGHFPGSTKLNLPQGTSSEDIWQRDGAADYLYIDDRSD